jgi:hypothetical protein
LFSKFYDLNLVSSALAMSYFARCRTPAIGFETIAGRNDGLRRILHLHHREEILRTPMIFSRFELPDRLPDSSTP